MKKILIIQLRQLGDILLTIPCARELKRENPSVFVGFLAHEMGRPLLETSPFIDKTFYYKETDSIRETFQLIKKLREEHFSIVFDFMNNPRSALQAFFSGALEKVSFTSVRSFFYTQVVKRPPNYKGYIVNEKFLLLEAKGFKPKDISLTLDLGSSDHFSYKKLLEDNPDFDPKKPSVVFSVTHRRVLRKWPGENYVALAQYLVTCKKAQVLWIYGPGEEEEIDALMSACNQKTFKSPKTTLRSLAYLLTQMDLFIGNSNGPSHIAVCSDIFSIQLHGPHFSGSWCPPGNPKHSVVQAKDWSTNKHAIKNILLSEVIERLESIWDNALFARRV